jgi:hypothetical protein
MSLFQARPFHPQERACFPPFFKKEPQAQTEEGEKQFSSLEKEKLTPKNEQKQPLRG